MKRSLLGIGAALAAMASASCQKAPLPPPPPEPPPVIAPAPPPPTEVHDIKVARVARNKTLTATLLDMGLAGEQVTRVINALKNVFDFRKSRIGDQVRVTQKEGELVSLEYRASEVDEWLVRREADGLVAEKLPVEIEKRVEAVDIPIDSSLYDAMVGAGEDPSLAVDLADVFAWDIDFYRDVRRGDSMRVVVEKQYVKGKLLRYGPILGARYQGELVGSRQLLRYTTAGGETTYFDEKGQSAKKAFLKTPLKFVHITSGFGGRRHPLLGFVQNHPGVDFAAALGTPVWSVADGTVARAVHNDPGAGNYLAIRHTNGYETVYMHLSRFGEGVHVGARVRQKQIVAYSGNTGLSTGPHLHFELRRNGTRLNPMAQKFPRAEPLARTELPRFLEETAATRDQLTGPVAIQRPPAGEPTTTAPAPEPAPTVASPQVTGNAG